MARYLVVCDQTLESQKLLTRLQEQRMREDCTFHVLLPASPPPGTWTWTEGANHTRAQARLDRALHRFRARGLDVSGEVGDPNLVRAVADVLLRDPGVFGAILLCTPPLGVSRRLGQDLVHRVERAVTLPVDHLVAAPTRPYRGREIPQAGAYEIDTAHSSVDFIARFLTITKVRGRFTGVAGTLHIAEVPEESSVEIAIDAASLRTGDDRRDAHLHSSDFLDVERYPTLAFQSTKVEPATEENWRVTGDLTIREVAREVVLDIDFAGIATTASGEHRAGFSGSAEIDREDWGIIWNQVLETGGFVVSKRLQVELDVQAILTE